jgi:hypothetical protein
MSFDLDKLESFCAAEIERFAQAHREETFYAFAIDADLLCLNSEEQFEQSVKRYQEKWDRQTRHVERWEDLSENDLREIRWLLEMAEKFSGIDRTDTKACLAVINDEREKRRRKGCCYRTDQGISSLRENTGDWAYQGFAEMTDAHGFDHSAYQEHYNMSENDQQTSAYGLAMNVLVTRLLAGSAFDRLRRSPQFYATRVEHDY